jgi:hypothetical protein
MDKNLMRSILRGTQAEKLKQKQVVEKDCEDPEHRAWGRRPWRGFAKKCSSKVF